MPTQLGLLSLLTAAYPGAYAPTQLGYYHGASTNALMLSQAANGAFCGTGWPAQIGAAISKEASTTVFSGTACSDNYVGLSQLNSLVRPDYAGLVVSSYTMGTNPCPAPPASVVPWITCDSSGNAVTFQPGMASVCTTAACLASVANPVASIQYLSSPSRLPASISALTALQIFEVSNYGVNYHEATSLAIPTQIGLLTNLTRLGIWYPGPSGTM